MVFDTISTLLGVMLLFLFRNQVVFLLFCPLKVITCDFSICIMIQCVWTLFWFIQQFILRTPASIVRHNMYFQISTFLKFFPCTVKSLFSFFRQTHKIFFCPFLIWHGYICLYDQIQSFCFQRNIHISGYLILNDCKSFFASEETLCHDITYLPSNG